MSISMPPEAGVISSSRTAEVRSGGLGSMRR